jgi:hypothetical protein
MTALIPAPNLPTFPSNYFAVGSYQFNRDNADLKINYNPTGKSSVFARYSISPSDIFDPPSLGPAGGDALAGGQPGNAPGRIQTASVGGAYAVNPRVLVDANLGFTRQRLGAQNVDINRNFGLEDLRIPGTNGADRLQGGYPRFAISGWSSIGNPNVSNPFLFRDNQYTLTGNVSYIRGAHNFRFGSEYTYYTINHFQPQAPLDRAQASTSPAVSPRCAAGPRPRSTTDSATSCSVCPKAWVRTFNTSTPPQSACPATVSMRAINGR